MSAHWFIADLHLSPESEGPMRAFGRLAAAVPPGDTLWILGDLFEFWAGPGHAALPDYRQILEAMKACRGKVRFLPGNRDFLFDAGTQRSLGVEPVAGVAHVLAEGSLRIYLAHGDYLCPNDRAYLRAAAVLRNPVSLWLERRVPFALAYRLAKGYREHSEAKRGRGPAPAGTYAMSEAMLAGIADRLDATDLVIGHVHAPADRLVAGCCREATLHILDPWHGDGAPFLKLEGGVFERGKL